MYGIQIILFNASNLICVFAFILILTYINAIQLGKQTYVYRLGNTDP